MKTVIQFMMLSILFIIGGTFGSFAQTPHEPQPRERKEWVEMRYEATEMVAEQVEETVNPFCPIFLVLPTQALQSYVLTAILTPEKFARSNPQYLHLSYNIGVLRSRVDFSPNIDGRRSCKSDVCEVPIPILNKGRDLKAWAMPPNIYQKLLS